MKTADAARGKWRGILLQLGVEEKFLRDKHGPCPMCGGVDRYRWDNKGGSGSYICGQCGAGNGFDLAMNVLNRSFVDVAREVDQLVGNVKPDAIRKPLDEEKRVEILNNLWANSQLLVRNDLVCRYLAARGIVLTHRIDALRFHPRCRAPNGSDYPTMLAMVSRPDGTPATLHRTFLADGRKADIDEPRALMPGMVPDGASIHLSEPAAIMGIAEGIETALAASKKFGIPVWAAINSTMLKKWEPPAIASEIVVFGDNDPKFGGAAAAYTLAHRLAVKGRTVSVQIPQTLGHDWADEVAA